MKRLMVALATWLMLAWCVVGRAAPLDDRIPHDSLLYAGWAGADALAPQYNGSNLQSLIDASAVKGFLASHLPQWMHQAQENDPKNAAEFQELKNGLGILWRRPTAFYFCPLGLADPQHPTFRFGIICDAGSDAATLHDLIATFLTQQPPSPDLPVQVAQDGNIVLVAFGKSDSVAALRAGGVLATDPAYMKAMAQVKSTVPAVAIYGDLKKVLALIDEGRDKTSNSAEDQAQYKKVIDALGVRSLGQFALAAGFEGKGWSEKAFLALSGPRTGLLTLLNNPPLSPDALLPVPQDAAAFDAEKLDLHRLYTEALAIVAKIDEETGHSLDQTIARANSALGLNIETDLIAPLGDEWIFYRAPLPQGGISMALVNKLKNGDTLSKALQTLEKLFNESGSPVRIEKVAAGKAEVSALLFLQYSIAWTVRDGYLYISTLDGMGGAIAQVEEKKPSIETSDLYKKVMAGMAAAAPGGRSGGARGAKPSSISYSHPARLYPDLRALVLGILPMIRGQGIDIPMTLLPDPSQVRAFMTPGGSIEWADADGIHVEGHTAFPGAEAMGMQIGAGGVTSLAILPAIMLPSMGRARELSSRAEDSVSLRGIVMGTIVWANDHNDQLPDHLGRMLANGQLSPAQLVGKRSATPPLEMTADVKKLASEDFARFAEMVDEHCDFVYVGKGMKLRSNVEVAVAFEKIGRWSQDGINIAYQDGHVQFVRWADLPGALAATNDYLKKNNLPPVDIESLMRNGPPEARMIPLPTAPRPPLP